MGRKKPTSDQIVNQLQEIEDLLGNGKKIGEACTQLGISAQTYYRWRREFGNLKKNQTQRLKDLEQENSRLKRAVTDLTLDKLILKEEAEGKTPGM